MLYGKAVTVDCSPARLALSSATKIPFASIQLNVLQEAAKILKIKGLWESSLDPSKEESDEDEEEREIVPVQPDSNLGQNVESSQTVKAPEPVTPVSPSMPELKSPPSLKSMMQVAGIGSKRRKRSRNGTGSIEEVQNEGPKQTKVH